MNRREQFKHWWRYSWNRDLIVIGLGLAALIGVLVGGMVWFESAYPCTRTEPQLVCESGPTVVVGKVVMPATATCSMRPVCVERAQ